MSAGPAGAPLDVLVIGGGQAGLAMGYHLAQRGPAFQIVDAGAEIGHVWRSRWDSLRLFTSGRYDNLPGLPVPRGRGHLPGQGRGRGLPAGLRGRVRAAGPARHHRDLADPRRRRQLRGQGRRPTRWRPARSWSPPAPSRCRSSRRSPAELDPGVHQLHSADYRRPEQLPPGRVLVVGAANSGCQIAQELSATHRSSSRPASGSRPCRSGRWAATSGGGRSGLRLDRVTADSRLGRRLAGRDQIVGAGPRQLARRHGITDPAPRRRARPGAA